jgi:hypothetical protein
MDSLRWSSARIVVIGADYSEHDTVRWTTIDKNYLAVGSDGKKDWNVQGFWDDMATPTRKFHDIYIDRCCLFIFATSTTLFANVLNFIQIHLSDNGRLHMNRNDWNVLVNSYMISRFCEASKVRQTTGRSKTDTETLTSLVSLGRFIPGEDSTGEWIVLYSIRSNTLEK